ncbi:unnamed protein product [Coccothraustes coccothraustes]
MAGPRDLLAAAARGRVPVSPRGAGHTRVTSPRRGRDGALPGDLARPGRDAGPAPTFPRLPPGIAPVPPVPPVPPGAVAPPPPAGYSPPAGNHGNFQKCPPHPAAVVPPSQ